MFTIAGEYGISPQAVPDGRARMINLRPAARAALHGKTCETGSFRSGEIIAAEDPCY
jgi:hypothetical protein